MVAKTQKFQGGIVVRKSLVLLVAWVAMATPQLNAKIQIHNEAYVEKTKKVKKGKVFKEVKVIEKAGKVIPGEDVIFVITYKNAGKESATDVVITNPVPKHTSFKSSETENNEDFQVSVDNGKKYGELKKLKVKEIVNKKSMRRRALAKDVTHVRFRLTKALAPNESGKVKIRATLK